MRRFARDRIPEIVIVLLAIGLRVSMAWSYDVTWGYDYPSHRLYVQWLLDHGSLPRFDLHHATYHPPLFYALAATMLRAGFANQSLAWISIIAGCLRIVLLWVGLEACLPRHRRARLVALALAAVLPASLHLDGMATNEGLSALFCLIATLLVPAVLSGDDTRRRLRAGAGMGAALGLALLSKHSAAMLIAALVAGAVIDLVWRWRSGLRGPRAIAARLAPLVLAATVAFTLSGWFYVRNKIHYGKFAPNGYDGSAHVVVDEMRKTPYLDRRSFGYLLGFDVGIFADPYYPQASIPRARFLSLLVATTFADYFSFRFAPTPRAGEPSVTRVHRAIPETAYGLSLACVAAGAVVALTTVLAWFAITRAAWRRRHAATLTLLLFPAAALVGQLHFAIEYPNDTYGPVKGVYLQFAAPVMLAVFGLGVEWLWARPRWLPLAGLCLAAVLAVAPYTLYCRLSPREAPAAKAANLPGSPRLR
jgi:4-amino-4-deoxy-L-arabinose transferase-like glycosyltransferase